MRMRMRMRMKMRMNIGAMLGFHDELIFRPPIDQTKSSNRIQIKSGKKNENENVKENENHPVSARISRDGTT